MYSTLELRICEFFILQIEDKSQIGQINVSKMFEDDEEEDHSIEAIQILKIRNRVGTFQNDSEDEIQKMINNDVLHEKFKKENKQKLLIALLEQSLRNEYYDITILTLYKFMKELNQSILSNFIISLQVLFKENSKYEFKLEIL